MNDRPVPVRFEEVLGSRLHQVGAKPPQSLAEPDPRRRLVVRYLTAEGAHPRGVDVHGSWASRVRAARSVFEQKQPATPRSSGEREALRALMAAREGAVNAKRAGLCQLRDLLITTPEPLRSELRPLSRARLLRRLAATRPERRHDPELRGTLLALRALARRVQQLTVEERALAGEIEQLISKLAPQLLSQPGIGPLLAAQIVLSWSHPGRLASEAAFARLAGAAPIPASSGQTIRYRLDRGGDRRLNRASTRSSLLAAECNDPPTTTSSPA